MKNEILFTENQRFKQWWLWVVLLAIDAMFIFGFIKQIVLGKQFGDKPMSNFGLALTGGVMILATMFFISLRLDTQIRRDGIYVRFFPVRLSFKRYSWENVFRSYVRQYNAIAEYGGWGYRMGFLGKGRALNVSGSQGLQLEFKDHKKLLIGTNKPEELEKVLHEIGRLN